MLQSAFVLGSGSSVPDGDDRGEDELNGGVKMNHHGKVSLFSCHRKYILCFDKGADV